MLYVFVNSTSKSNNSILLTMKFLKLSSEDSCLILEVSYLALQFEVFWDVKVAMLYQCSALF